MGRQGNFQINYDVMIAKLQSDFRRVEGMARVHRANLSIPVAAAPTDPVKLKKFTAETSRLNAETRRMSHHLRAAAADQKKLNQAAGKGSTVFRHLSLAFRRMILWWSTAAVLLGAQRLVKQVGELAGAFQFAIRELTVLGEEGEAVYRRLGIAGFEAAAATGRSFSEAADAMKAWIRQGYSAAEVAALTRTTLIGLNLTELSSIELVRTLTAQMKAFNIPASQSITIIDQLLGVSRKFAIETTQLARGMRRFAAVSNEAGLSLQQQAGLMTAMMVRTQQAAQMVGRAGRTILVRLRRNAVEVLETVAKIQVFTDQSRQTYRAMFDVLSDLADKWGDMTDAQRAQIAFQAAGLRQQEFFIALMEDFGLAQEAVIVALESAGLAYKSNRALVDTYQKSIAALRTEWEKALSTQTGILDFLQGLVNGLRLVVKEIAVLPAGFIKLGVALTAVGGLILAFTVSPLVGGFIALAGAVALLAGALSDIRGAGLAELVQRAREHTEARAAEADSIEKLTRLFIKYKEEVDAGKDRETELRRTREALIKLNPSLVSGAETLEETYGRLVDQLDNIVAANQAAAKSFRDLERATAQLSATEASRDVLKLVPEVGALGRGIDPRNVKEVEKLADLLHNEVLTGIQEIIALDKELSDAAGNWSEAMTPLIEKRRKMLDLALAEERIAAGVQSVLAGRSLFDLEEERERAIGKVLAALTKHNEGLEKEANTVTALAVAYETLKKSLAAIPEVGFRVALPKIPTEIGEGTPEKEEIRKATKVLENQLKLQELIRQEVFYTRADERAHKIEAAELVELAVTTFNAKRKTLQTVIDANKSAAERVAAEQLLAKFGADGVEQAKLDLGIAKAKHAQTMEQGEINAKLHLDRIKAAKAELESELRLEKVDIRRNNDILEGQIQIEAAVLRRTQSDATVASKVLGIWTRVHLERMRQAEDLEREHGIEDPRAVQARAAATQADDRRRQAALTTELAVITEATAAFEHRKNVMLAEQGARIDMLSLEQGELVAIRAQIKYTEDQIVQQKRLVATGGDKRELDKLEIDLIKQKVEEQKIQHAATEKLKKAVEVRNEAEVQAIVDRIRATQGDIAATARLVAIREEASRALSAGEIPGATPEDREKAKERLTEARSKHEIARLKEFQDFEKELAKLRGEREEDSLAHEIAMAELQGGRLAGLDAEIQFWLEKFAAAKKVEDTSRRILLMNQAINGLLDAGNAKYEEQNKIRQQGILELLSFAGQQLQALLTGEGDVSGFIQGAAGVAASFARGVSPYLAQGIIAVGGVLGTLFEEPADDLSDSLDRNTTAIDRNTQTLQDVFEQRIGVPTGFALPSFITMQGALPGGGGTVIQQNQYDITIPIDGRGQDAEQIAVQVQRRLDRQLSVNARRGMGTNVLSLG